MLDVATPEHNRAYDSEESEGLPDFTQTYERYSVRLSRLLFRLLGDASQAEDLTQEVFVRFIEKQPRDSNGIESWLYTTARRLCADVHREQGRHQKFNNACHSGQVNRSAIFHANGYDVAVNREISAAIRKAMDDMLDPAIAEAGRLFYFEDFKMREIAQALRSPLSTAQTRVFRFRQQMRSALERHNV